jgi:AAA family ATP:ADP antiporter
MSSQGRVSPVSRFLKVAAKIEPNELKATLLSFAFVFTLMAAYFILRPVRDAMSSDWSDEELSWLPRVSRVSIWPAQPPAMPTSSTRRFMSG